MRMRVAVVIAFSTVALCVAAATAGAARTTIESQAVCGALRANVGSTTFAAGFKSAASCRAKVSPFELRLAAAVRRMCKGNAACVSALTEQAAAAARNDVTPMQACTARFGTPSLTHAFVACLVSTFKNELN